MPTVLITGASTGIGRACALRLAMAGWEVFAGVRDPDAGERLRADFDRAGGERGGDSGRRGRIEPIALDVTDSAQIEAAARAIAAHGDTAANAPTGPTGAAGGEIAGSGEATASVEAEASGPSGAAGGETAARVAAATSGAANGPTKPGRLDALVNNAGIGIGGPLELVSPDDLRKQFEVNVFGQIAITRALLPALRAARGRIVLLSSIGGRVSVPYNGPYAASKHALEALGDALRGELHSSRVTVSLIEPGSVKTPIWGKAKELAGTLAIPPELQHEYGDVPRAFEKVLRDTERRGVSPERVAAAIERALTARRPRARYLVGADARGMVAARALLPTRAFDRVLRRALGL